MKIPIDLEETAIGANFDTLRDLISGKAGFEIEPYDYVSFRVIARMANILMAKKPDELNEDIYKADNVEDAMFKA